MGAVMWVFYTLWPRHPEGRRGTISIRGRFELDPDGGQYGAEAAFTESVWLVPGTVNPDE
jgi:hypothetical protein